MEHTRIDAVEVHQLQDGSHLMHHIAIKRNGNRLEVMVMHPLIDSLHGLVDFIPSNVPVVLILTGKGVLIRHITIDKEASDEELVRSVFPDARVGDFLFSKESQAENGSVFCLTRTQLAETIVKKFLAHKIQITDVFIGPLTVTSILSMLEPENTPIITGYCSFYIRSGQLIDVQPTPMESTGRNIKIGVLTLPEVMLCSFSAAFNFLVINRCDPSTPLPLVREKAQEVMVTAKVKGLLAIALGFLFIILLGNFFLFGHYTRKYNDLVLVVEENLTTARKTDSLLELIQQREQFLKQSSGTDNYKGSFIIDRIGASIPYGITLTEIAVHPILFKEEEVNQEPVYQPGKIRIQALVRESNALNKWIKRLEDMEWIESVAFSDYLEKEEHEAGVSLEITTK